MIYNSQKVVGRISIDLTGPQGNAYYLLALVKDLGHQLKKSEEELKKIHDDMTSSDYEHLISVFDSHFGNYVDLYRGNVDDGWDDDEEDSYNEDEEDEEDD